MAGCSPTEHPATCRPRGPDGPTTRQVAVGDPGREFRAPPPDSSASGPLPSTPPSSPEPELLLGLGLGAAPEPLPGAGVLRDAGAEAAGAAVCGAAGAELGPLSGLVDRALPLGVGVPAFGEAVPWAGAEEDGADEPAAGEAGRAGAGEVDGPCPPGVAEGPPLGQTGVP